MLIFGSTGHNWRGGPGKALGKGNSLTILMISKAGHVIQQINSKMGRRRNQGSLRKMKISVKRRMKLIDLVINQHYSMVRASRKLQLKPYTARSIVNKYRRDGLVYDHQTRKFINPEALVPENQELSEMAVRIEQKGPEEEEEVKIEQGMGMNRERGGEGVELSGGPGAQGWSYPVFAIFYFW